MGTNKKSEEERLCDEGIELRQTWVRYTSDMKLLERAQETFRRVIELSPSLWKGHYGLGEILLLWQDTKPKDVIQEGLHEVWTAAHLAPNQSEPPVRLAAALSYINLEAAKQFYDYATRLQVNQPIEGMYPDNWKAGKYWEFAINAAQGGLHDASVEAFQRALDLAPQYDMYSITLPLANECLNLAKASAMAHGRKSIKDASSSVVLELPVLPNSTQ